jgi:hypothetical protein
MEDDEPKTRFNSRGEYEHELARLLSGNRDDEMQKQYDELLDEYLAFCERTSS